MFCESAGSGQGTVISEDGVWAGSIHQNETLQCATLCVDGAPVAVQDGNIYTGQCIAFSRATILGETYNLTSTMILSGHQSAESVTLQRTGSDKNVGIVYGFLGSRANRLTEYAAFDKSGTLTDSGTSCQDDGSFIYLEPAIATAQFDPAASNGVLSVVTAGSEYGLDQFIWDRAEDNKLYCRFHDIEGILPEGTVFELQQTLTFFNAVPESWIDTAQGFVPEPSSAATALICCVLLLGRRRARAFS